MAPVIRALKKKNATFMVVTTDQQQELLTDTMKELEIGADIKLKRGAKESKHMLAFMSRTLDSLRLLFEDARPEAVIAQGDTLTVLAAAQASFFHHIPFGLVEAGLRTGNINSPYPEEYNRIVATIGSRWLFAATERARTRLLTEGSPEYTVHVTGNTVVDSIKWALLKKPVQLPLPGIKYNAPVIVTCHRRETWGEPLLNVCAAILGYAQRNPDREIWWPVHPNPAVNDVVSNAVKGGPANIKLMQPMPYVQFIHAMASSALIVTDSGGISEEVATLGKRALILRDTTERPECLDKCCKLVGTGSPVSIRQEMERAIEMEPLPPMDNPFGDGKAGDRIAEILLKGSGRLCS